MSKKQSSKQLPPLHQPMPKPQQGMPGKGTMQTNLQRMPMAIPKARKPKR